MARCHFPINLNIEQHFSCHPSRTLRCWSGDHESPETRYRDPAARCPPPMDSFWLSSIQNFTMLVRRPRIAWDKIPRSSRKMSSTDGLPLSTASLTYSTEKTVVWSPSKHRGLLKLQLWASRSWTKGGVRPRYCSWAGTYTGACSASLRRRKSMLCILYER